VKVNPYTKEEMPLETIPYNDREVTNKKVYNYILGNIPDFTYTIDSLNKFHSFNDTNDIDINKVILLSDKKKTPSLLKALSC